MDMTLWNLGHPTVMGEREDEETLFDQETLLNGGGIKFAGRSEWCRKFTKTAVLSVAFFALGLCIAIPGPTLLDLGERVHTDTEHMSLIFTARSIGYLIGSIIGGFLFDHFDQQILLFYSLFLTAIATTVAPWCSALTVLAVMIAFQGLSMGVLDTGGNVFCIKIWGRKSGPYMQAVHFAFGMGAFVAPLLAKPFLVNHSLLDVSNRSLAPVMARGPRISPLILGAQKDRFWRFERELATNDSELVLVHEAINNSTVSTTLTSGMGNLTLSSSVGGSTTPALSISVAPKKPKNSDTSKDRDALKDFEDAVRESKNKKPDTNTTPVGKTQSPESQSGLINPTNETVKTETAAPAGNTSAEVIPKRYDNSSSSAVNTSPAAATAGLSPVLPSSTSISSTTPAPMQVTSTPAATQVTSTPAPTQVTSTPAPTTSTPTTTPSTTGTTTSIAQTPPTTLTTLAQSIKTQVPNLVSSAPQSVSAEQPTSPSSVASGMSSTQASPKPDSPTTRADISNISTTETHKKPDSIGEFFNNAIDSIRNMSKIQFAYAIIGVLLIVNSFMFLILYCQDRNHASVFSQDEDRDGYYGKQSRGYRISMLVILFFFFFVYVGMEVTFGGLLSTFTVEYMQWSKSRGAVVTAIFWGSLCAGRGIAIFIARCFKPPCMLITDLVLIILGAVVLSFGLSRSDYMMWIGTFVIGFGMSSVFPTGISWADSYFPVTGKSTAVFVVGSALGEMLIPALTGSLYEKQDKMTLMYMMLALGLLLALIYIIMQCVALRRRKLPTSRNGFVPLREDDNISMDTMDQNFEGSGLLETSRHRQPKKHPKPANMELEYSRLVDIDD